MVGDNQTEEVKKITPHFLFSDRKHNLAVVQLVNELNFTDLIQPISLSNSSEIDEVTALGVQRLANGVNEIN